jgi:hypothetical protein
LKIASSYLKFSAVGLTAAAAAATTVAEVTTIVPATGFWGWLGMTTTATTAVQVPLLASQPWVIPALAAYGAMTLSVPIFMVEKAKQEWSDITTLLNKKFRLYCDLERPDLQSSIS